MYVATCVAVSSTLRHTVHPCLVSSTSYSMVSPPGLSGALLPVSALLEPFGDRPADDGRVRDPLGFAGGPDESFCAGRKLDHHLRVVRPDPLADRVQCVCDVRHAVFLSCCLLLPASLPHGDPLKPGILAGPA